MCVRTIRRTDKIKAEKDDSNYEARTTNNI